MFKISDFFETKKKVSMNNFFNFLKFFINFSEFPKKF